jgi:holin-like protein
MINGLLQLLICQLVGEFTAKALNLPVPGPVIGMVVLFVFLQIRRPGTEAGIFQASDGLLRHLQLLFIPVGAGVIQYLPLIAQSWLPILGGLVISWLAALVVTAGVGSGTLRMQVRLTRTEKSGTASQ